MVAFAHAQEFADDFDCQRQRVVFDHVHVAAAACSAIEQRWAICSMRGVSWSTMRAVNALIDEAAQAGVGLRRRH